MATNSNLDRTVGKIYEIRCNITGERYIGQTMEPTLARRLAGHRSMYNRYLAGATGGCSSFQIIDRGDYQILLLEEIPNSPSRDLLRARERWWIDNTECVNQNGRTLTDEMYLARLEEYKRRYHEKNIVPRIAKGLPIIPPNRKSVYNQTYLEKQKAKKKLLLETIERLERENVAQRQLLEQQGHAVVQP